ncbi:MAG: guanine deaminase [Candidatus Melainabacteria bacterium]|nr:guanine deaminase [Candidatus Melainabacteria bacterium]
MKTCTLYRLLGLKKIMACQAIKTFYGHIIYARDEKKLVEYKSGALGVDQSGRIYFCGSREDLDLEVKAGKCRIEESFDFGEKLILPGFVDTHLHLPQFGQTGKYGKHLLGWLESFIFPEEAKFRDEKYAYKISEWFFEELLKNGTTTANIFTTIHKQACNAAFEVASKTGIRAVMGKVIMNRNCPDYLSENSNDAIKHSVELMEKWHGHDNNRLLYAFIPRFAPSCTNDLLNQIGVQLKANPSVYMHTHVSESAAEVKWVQELFPEAKSYTDVYARAGLLGPMSVLAHAIHLNEHDYKAICDTDSALSHCPSSNFFLKSGTFAFATCEKKQIRFGLGSDIGAGPQMSMFQVMKDGFYIQPDLWIEPAKLFYRATLGGAKALNLHETTGSLEAGKDADFIIVNTERKSNIPANILQKEIDEILSSLIFLGDDRIVESTFVRGKCVFGASLLNSLVST